MTTTTFSDALALRSLRLLRGQIQLLGCRTGARYGRDRRAVSYVLAHSARAETSPVMHLSNEVPS